MTLHGGQADYGSATGRHERFLPRKTPRQQRSRMSVDSIKKSALELAMTRGPRAITTEEIAARAGVNIGSLYQYFPNKDAILFALYEDASARLLDRMKALTADIFDLPLEKAAYRAMERLLALYEEHRFVLLQLPSEIPDLRNAVRSVSFETLHRGSMRAFINHRLNHAKHRELERMTFFVGHIGTECIRTYLLEGPEAISRREFLTDLSWILAAYIRKG
jgi:AcrR family transcriptional regulator